MKNKKAYLIFNIFSLCLATFLLGLIVNMSTDPVPVYKSYYLAAFAVIFFSGARIRRVLKELF